MRHDPRRLLGILVAAFLSGAGSAFPQDQHAFASVDPVYFPALSQGNYTDDALTELSGLAVGIRNEDLVWSHNDEDESKLFALRRDGTLAATLSLGVDVSDLEDIAIGPGPEPGTPYLYVGDTGGKRSTVVILRTPEPVTPFPETVREVEVIVLRYPDGSYPSETVMVDPLSGDLIVVTKEKDRARFYLATAAQMASGRPSVMRRIADISFDVASGGDISSDGRLVVLRNETQAILWKRDPADSIGDSVSVPGHPVPVAGPPVEKNGEGIAFERNSAAYLTIGEGKGEHLFLFRPNPSGFGSGEAVGILEDDGLKEISGCALSLRTSGVMWVHEDGAIDEIYAIDIEGKILATVQLGQAVVDAEDIAIGRIGTAGTPYLFVGDFGDNASKRTSIAVLRFPEPEVPTTSQSGAANLAADGVERLELIYPGPPSDCEALLFDPISEDLLLATKEEAQSRVFSVPAMAAVHGTHRLALISTIGFELVSGGDISPAGDEFVLRREERAELWTRRPGQSWAAALAAPSREIPVMTPPVEANGEAIGFAPDGGGYYTIGEMKGTPIFYFRRLEMEKLIHLAPPIFTPEGWQLPMQGFPNLEISVERSRDLFHWTRLGSVRLDSRGTASPAIDAAAPAEFFRLTH